MAKRKSKVKPDKTSKPKTLSERLKDCAEIFRKMPGEPIKEFLFGAGCSVQRALDLGAFKEFANRLDNAYSEGKRESVTGGEKSLWKGLVRILRRRANLPYTSNYSETFAEDCQLVVDALLAEIEEIQWDKDPNCISATKAIKKLNTDFGIERSLSWITKLTKKDDIRFERKGQTLKIYWPDLHNYIERKKLNNTRFMREATQKAQENILKKIIK